MDKMRQCREESETLWLGVAPRFVVFGSLGRYSLLKADAGPDGSVNERGKQTSHRRVAEGINKERIQGLT